MQFTVPSTGGFSRKLYSSLVLKNPSKKRKLDCIHEWHYIEGKNEVSKPDKN
jgi:hypothetical protein